MMKLKVFHDNIAQINSYLLSKENHLLVIDPGFNAEAILDYIKANQLHLEQVILTHGHYDHIRGIERLAKEFAFSLLVSQTDSLLLKDDDKNYAKAFGSTFRLPSNVSVIYTDSSKGFQWNQESFQIIDTPGHTKGSICIRYQNWLFTGDTVFTDSVGRTDLFSGNQTDLLKSLRYLTDHVSHQTTIYPGHGPSGKWSVVKKENPYL
ncbi:MAG: MBL fold metallo-hydrolase [Bacilli bacterium]|nr:MBL fold metallo-hydrolase [Bacilli bacterium]MBN2877912.1 MBL fold metallo-hydrolase [Bacilli bacterium]